MKYWTIRIAEPSPFGLTLLLAITRAMVCASLLNRPWGGAVETVFTPRTHRFAPLPCDLFLLSMTRLLFGGEALAAALPFAGWPMRKQVLGRGSARSGPPLSKGYALGRREWALPLLACGLLMT